LKIVAIIIGAIALFRSPFGAFMYPTVSMYLLIHLVFKMGATMLLAYHVAKINKWVGGMIAVGAISLMHPVYSNFSDTYLFLMVCYGIVYMSVQQGNKDHLFTAMRVFVIVHVFSCVLQYIGISTPWVPAEPGRVEGLMGNLNGASGAIALCIPLFFKKPWLYLLPVPVLGLFLINSSGGMIGSFFAGMIYIWMVDVEYKKQIAYGSVLLLACFFIFYDTPNIMHRSECWQRVFPIYFNGLEVKFQKLLGVGIGNWKLFNQVSIQAGNITPGWDRLHNVFLQGFMEMGFPFLILLTGYVITTLKRLREPLYLSALGAIWVVCMGNSVFHQNAINGMFIVIWLGLIGRHLRRI